MVAAFLKAEIDSPRWRNYILTRLAQDGRPRTIIDSPELDDVPENEYRASLLSYRGYRQNAIFSGFPENTRWQTALLEPTDCRNLRVMKSPEWTTLSATSRTASDVVKSLTSGKTQHALLTQVLGAVERLRAGEILPEMILVSTSVNDLIVMEGHVRTMAILFSDRHTEFPAVIGTSEKM